MHLTLLVAWRRHAICLLSFFLLFVSVAAHAEPKKVELALAVPDGAKVDKNLKEALDLLAAALANRLHTYDDLSLPLPQSVVPDGVDFVAGETPLSVAAERELVDSAHGPDGTRLTLSPEQWRSIRKKGYYLVPSKNFPGQFHKWEMWLLEGSDKITLFVRNADAVSTRILRIGMPELFKGNQFSVRLGFLELGKGLRGLVAHTVGFVETYPKHGPEAVARLIADDMVEYLEGLAEVATGKKFDLRALNPELVARAQPVLEAIEKEIAEAHGKAVVEARRIVDPDERRRRLDALEEETRTQRPFLAAVEASEELEKVGQGLGPVLARYARALQRLRAQELNFQDEVTRFTDEKRAELTKEYPSLAEDRPWLDGKVQEAAVAYHRSRWSGFYENALADLRGNGFEAEAWALQHSLDYLRNEGWERARALSRERLPEKVIPYEFWSLDAGKWKKKQLQNGTWVAEPTSRVQVTSRYPFWKAARLWYTTGWSFQAGLRTVLVDWLWNGPVGLQSWGKNPYPGSYQVDAKTGELVAPPSGYHSTFWTNLKALYASIRRDRDAYNKAPDSGMFGKYPKRVWQFFWSDLGKGVVAPVFLFFGRTIATTVTALVGGGVVVTSPAWAPLAGTLEYGWTTFIADNYAVRDLPNYSGQDYTEPGLLVDTLRITLSGAGQIVAAGILGAVGTPIAAAGTSVGARVLSWARHLWNGGMYYVHRGLGALFGAKVPTDDSAYFVTHKEGPGVGQSAFLSIDDDAIVLAALLQLEVQILDAYRLQLKTWQNEPYTNARAVITSIPWGALGLAVNAADITRELSDQIAAPMAPSVKRMEEAIAARQKRLAPLLGALQDLTRRYGSRSVRLSQDQLDRLLPQLATAYAKLLGDDKYFPTTAPAVQQRFWDTNTAGVANDYPQLVRTTLMNVLGTQALTPPSLEAGQFETHVRHPTLLGMLEKVLAGNELDVEIKKTDVPTGPIVAANPADRPKPAPIAPPRVTVPVRATEICANPLVKLAREGIVESFATRK